MNGLLASLALIGGSVAPGSLGRVPGSLGRGDLPESGRDVDVVHQVEQ